MTVQIQHHVQRERIAELQQLIRNQERGRPQRNCAVHSTGCGALDGLFPQQGVSQGSLVEWIGKGIIGQGITSGAVTLSLITARQVCPVDRPIIVIDRLRHLSPVGMVTLGFDLSRVVFVRPSSEREALWACEEALRCSGVGLVWAEFDHLSSTAARRLQLAAEESAGIGFLLRSANALRQSCWAEVRLVVQPRSSPGESPRFHLEAVYSQGRLNGSTVDIQIAPRQGILEQIALPNTCASRFSIDETLLTA